MGKLLDSSSFSVCLLNPCSPSPRCLPGVFEQSQQWTLLSQGPAHGADAEGPQIPPAATGRPAPPRVSFVSSRTSLSWRGVCLQELVKHTVDATEKENLRAALDAMRVSVQNPGHGIIMGPFINGRNKAVHCMILLAPL